MWIRENQAWCLALLVCWIAGCTDEPKSMIEASTVGESTEGVGESSGDDGPDIICDPGQTRCRDASTLEVCASTGLEWEALGCDVHEVCEPCDTVEPTPDCAAACIGPCDRLADAPSSAGCSFYATSLYGIFDDGLSSALVVSNPDHERSATVELSFVPLGTNIEEPVGEPVTLVPGGVHVFELPWDPSQNYDYAEYSRFRSGQVHHLTSNLPLHAHLHTPSVDIDHSASTMLLPEHVLTGSYVVYGYPPYVPPNYFSVIALENQTTLRWWPTAATAGDSLPLPFVPAGAMGEQLLNRFDNVRIDSSRKYDPPTCQLDLSGTIIVADKPVWVASAVVTANVPFCDSAGPSEGCATDEDPDCGGSTSDFMMEQLIPLDYWGRQYVGPHAPLRGGEEHHWRVFAGADDITVNVEPAVSGTPLHLAARGDWVELTAPHGTSLVFSGDGPFMPVQYVTSNFRADIPVGGAAMAQMIPTEQFQQRYVFATRADFDQHYAQVIAPLDGTVRLDGVAIEPSAWSLLGGWRIATIEVDEGVHTLDGESAFGALQYGYTVAVPWFGAAGYGYPIGLRAEPLVVP